MTDLNQIPPVRLSLTEELKHRMDSRPDKYTLAWWEKRFDELIQAYRGACHSINLAVANTRDNETKLAKFGERIEQLERENINLKADIGEMLSEIAAMKNRIERMAVWAKTKGLEL